MTPKQFQDVHGPWLKDILSDPKGQALINALTAFQPQFPTSEVPHLFAKGVGQREGFETCVRSLVLLASAPKTQNEVPQNYGVTKAE